MVAAEALRRNVIDLCRVRFRQVLVEALSGGVLAALVLSTIAVPLLRSERPDWPLPAALATVFVVCLAATFVMVWLKRESPLQVAIRADLELNLKERLNST